MAEAGYCCDPIRLFVLLSYGAVDGFGGAEAMARARCGEREQRDCLLDRDADGTAWVHSGESVLYWGLYGEYPIVGEGGERAVFPLMAR
jgi:hypothetical protein